MGWLEIEGPRLWRMSLLQDETSTPDITAPNAQKSTLKAFSAYNSPNVEDLIRYFHAAAGLPVRYTWIKAIKTGNFDSWTGITYQNSTKYCPTWKKQSREIWSRHDNMSSRLDQRENTADLLNLYHQKDYLTKDTTEYTSRLHTPVNYKLMTRASFQLSQ